MAADPRLITPATASRSEVKSGAYGLAVRDALLALALGLVEVPMVMAYAAGRLPLPGLLVCHGLILLMMGLYAGSRASASGNTVLPTVSLLLLAALGPIGGLAAFLLCIIVRLSRGSDALLEEWYARISRSTEMEATTVLSERVAVDRVVGVDAPLPDSFADVIEHGPIEDRQAALGHIARHFHLDYLSVLALALRNPEPVIRAQAAAVAAKVKLPLLNELHRLFGAAEAQLSGQFDPAIALEVSHKLQSVTGYALVDDAERRRALALAAALNDRGLEALGVRLGDEAGATSAPQPGGASPADITITRAGALEELLLRRGRFAEFRRLRQARQTSQRAAE